MAFVQAQEFQLAGSGCTASATSIVITGFTLPDGTKITQAMFGSTGFGTLEPGTSREESISFTGITDNSDGTQTITGVTRGLQFQSPHAEDSDLKFKHAGSSKFVLSNTSAFYADQFLNREDNQTVTGQITFATEPLSSAGAPTDDNALVTKAYADSLSVGTVSINRTVIAGTAGATIASGNIVYLDVADQEWKLADSDTAYSTDTQFGIAQGAGTDGGAITNGVLIAGLDETQTGMTPGETYFIATTAGTLTTTEPTNSFFVGVAQTATKLIVDFQKDKQPAATAPDTFVSTSAGAGDAGKGVLLNPNGVFDSSFTTSPIVQTYTSSGSPHTWTKPAGLKYVIVEVQGSGKNGGNASGTSSGDNAAGGGASGGYAKKLIAATSLGSTETVTVGAGNGTTNTTFGSHCTGGYAGSSKGTASGGDLNISGQNGSPALNPDGDFDYVLGGFGGSSLFGFGGISLNGDNNRDASGYGAGGAGGNRDSNSTSGGTGAEGICIVTEYYN